MKARTLAIILISVTAIAIIAVVGQRLFASREANVNVDRELYPVRGIDISAHNGQIDFNKVLADSIDFVYIKASEGGTWRDALFEQNYRAATDAGLLVGIYHFFRFDVPGWKQSVNVLSALSGRHLDLPIAIDVEEWGNPGEYTTQEIVENLRSLVEMLRQNGREPIIYTNKNGYFRFVRGMFDDVGLWICSFTTPPIPDHERWHFWQHSHIGRVNGINGPVDLCTYNDPQQSPFREWLRTNPSIARTTSSQKYN